MRSRRPTSARSSPTPARAPCGTAPAAGASSASRTSVLIGVTCETTTTVPPARTVRVIRSRAAATRALAPRRRTPRRAARPPSRPASARARRASAAPPRRRCSRPSRRTRSRAGPSSTSTLSAQHARRRPRAVSRARRSGELTTATDVAARAASSRAAARACARPSVGERRVGPAGAAEQLGPGVLGLAVPHQDGDRRGLAEVGRPADEPVAAAASCEPSARPAAGPASATARAPAPRRLDQGSIGAAVEGRVDEPVGGLVLLPRDPGVGDLAAAATRRSACLASCFMSGCLTCQRPDICSTTSLESIRTSTCGVRVELARRPRGRRSARGTRRRCWTRCRCARHARARTSPVSGSRTTAPYAACPGLPREPPSASTTNRRGSQPRLGGAHEDRAAVLVPEDGVGAAGARSRPARCC